MPPDPIWASSRYRPLSKVPTGELTALLCRSVAVVHVTYYTDPACPWSWGAEPALRRILVEFGDDVAITYVMAGMLRDVTEPQHELVASLEASAATGMPVDPRVWHGRPPRSTYPACLAVKAAAEQRLDGPYLRVLREGFMVARRTLDTPTALEEAARSVDGLDLARFAIDLRSNAIAELFGADLERARSVPEQWRSADAKPPRAVLPTFSVGETCLSGQVDPEALSRAVRAAGATPRALPTVDELLRRFGRVATPEVAACCGMPAQRAAAELWRAAMEWRARPERVLAGELWAAA
jgi:predicted DsbA family dithiol-disulfide isomerase